MRHAFAAEPGFDKTKSRNPGAGAIHGAAMYATKPVTIPQVAV